MFRRIVFACCLGGCFGGPDAPAPSAPAPAAPRAHRPVPTSDDTGPVDALVELARPEPELGWIAPRALALVRGGERVDVPAGTPRMRAQILERQGAEVRIGARLPTARFAAWTEATGLLGVVLRETRVEERYGAPPPDERAWIALRAGAPVTVLARGDGRAHVRFLGAMEVDGWVPLDAIGTRGPAGGGGRPLFGAQVLSLVPGTAIRAEPRWGGRILAVLGPSTYFLVDLAALADDRHEVEYADEYVEVHGYASRRDPPERLRGPAASRTPPATAPAASATAPSGTCLFARARGEAIGYLIADAPVDLSPPQGSWFQLTLDTPWGPVTFAAQGTSPRDLVTCAPPGAAAPTRLPVSGP